MNTRYQINKDQASALEALKANGILDAALEALKEKLIRDLVATESHETKKREEYYTQYNMVGKLKEVIQAAINDAGDI
jgi:hypothetical protein